MELSESDQRFLERIRLRGVRFDSILDSFFKETDRGCALVAAAFLDEKLLELLQARAIEVSKTEDLNRFFLYDGPLGAFSARIKAAHLYGFIGPKVYRDLEYVRKIRNAFAHDPEHRTFQDEQIREWCGQFQHYLLFKTDQPKLRFIMTTVSLEGILDFAILEAERPSTRPDISDNAFWEFVKLAGYDVDTIRSEFEANMKSAAPLGPAPGT